MKRIFYLFFFLFFLPLDLGLTLVALQRINQTKEFPQLIKVEIQNLAEKKYPVQVYAALPAVLGETYTSIQTGDARPVIIAKYLEKYGSPMQPYDQVGQQIVQVSDELGLDWRLLIAIAQQESNLGKKMPYDDCHNAWGYGIHSRGILCFETWEEGIRTVAQGLKSKYVDQGLTTPEEIMAKYTPLSSGSWAFGVNQFLEELRLGEVE